MTVRRSTRGAFGLLPSSRRIVVVAGHPMRKILLGFEDGRDHERQEEEQWQGAAALWGARRDRIRSSSSTRITRIFALPPRRHMRGPLLYLSLVVLCFFLSLSSSCATASATSYSSSSSNNNQGAAAAAADSTTNPPMMSDYESVRALDEYGNAVQIQHAQAAADQRGRLVLALRRPKNKKNDDRAVVWILSPAAPKAAHHRISSLSATQQRLLQPVSSPEPPTVLRSTTLTTSNNQQHSAVYLCCTGVQADATWLLQAVRRYATGLAERYGSHQPRSVAYAVAHYQSQFWNNSNGDECWTTTLLAQGRQQQQPSWGRPLGVRSLVVTCCLSDDNMIRLQVVEPSGVVREIGIDEPAACWVMGKNSDLLWQELAKQNKRQDMDDALLGNDDDDDALKRLLWRAFCEVLSTQSSSDKKEEEDDAFELQLEIVSSTGEVRRETISKASLK